MCAPEGSFPWKNPLFRPKKGTKRALQAPQHPGDTHGCCSLAKQGQMDNVSSGKGCGASLVAGAKGLRACPRAVLCARFTPWSPPYPQTWQTDHQPWSQGSPTGNPRPGTGPEGGPSQARGSFGRQHWLAGWQATRKSPKKDLVKIFRGPSSHPESVYTKNLNCGVARLGFFHSQAMVCVQFFFFAQVFFLFDC